MNRHCTYIMRDQQRDVVPSLMGRKRTGPALRKLLLQFRIPMIGFGGMLLLII